MRVLIVVTHLLGSGHLARALTLSRAYIREGHDVIVASGGMPVPHLDFGDVPIAQLPPLRSDGVNFTRLLDADGAEAPALLIHRRQQVLLELLATQKPDILITELFPFGRRILKDEFKALLRAAHAMTPRPLICASVRDILSPPSKPEKAELAETLIRTFYDAVLVHSDPDIIPLSQSWPVSEALLPYLQYTGFVAPPAAGPHPDAFGSSEIIVSAGGGNVGSNIFQAALGAAELDPGLRWRLLIGGAQAKLYAERMNALAPANLHAEPARPDFRQILYHTPASVSMCGYNTALDILQAGTPALFIPFDTGGEVEQGLRATAMREQDGIRVLHAADLTPQALLAGLRKVMAAPRRLARRHANHGAEETVRITTTMKGEQP